VAISLDRSPLLITGLLGILKAGAAYVPLDPLYPLQRLAYIAADAKVRVLVTHSADASRLPAGNWSVVYLDQLEAETEDTDLASIQNPPRVAHGGNLAYVLYTSGSTGEPKGVAVEHRSVVNLIEWGLKTFSKDERAVMLASTSVNFDLSVFELFVTLSAGALVVLVDNLLTLCQAPAASKVTFINTVPSVMTEFLRIDEIPSSVRVVALAGESVSAPLVDRLYSSASIGRVFDLYGPTEATVYSTFALRRPQGPATIGRPIANTTALVLDDDRQAVPIGVTGELYLGGMGLAREYLGRPSLTAERFPDHPFDPGTRLYRTGDLARWLPDGSLQFLGRRDHQIKLRGFRVELGEIESALAIHAAIREVLVVKRGDSPQDARLVAYIVEAVPCANSELTSHLEQRLPSHMIPSVFVRLDALTRLPNRKVDRSALPDPPFETVVESSGAVLPRTPAEEAVAAIWRDVLGISHVGVHENFFQLGGHSLLATKVISRLRTTFKISLELRAIFDAPTIAGLAAIASSAPERASGPLTEDIQPAPRDRPLPLSFAQQRLWFLDQWNSGNGLYNIPAAFTLLGPLHVDALESSLRALMERHEALRTVFPAVNGVPTQTVRPQAELGLPVIDLTDRPEPSRSSMADTLATEEARRGFDLARGPLVRAVLFRLAEDEHRLLLTLHHIVADAWSLAVLFRELEALYRAAVGGAALELPTLRLQYPDFAVWQRNTFQGEYLARHLAYWQRQLAFPLPVLQLPFDRPRPMEMGSAGGRVQFSLAQRAAADLDRICRRERVTPFVALLAVFQVLLHRYSGQDDILVGTPVANRNRREIEDLVGCFVNTTVIRADLNGDPTFNELLKRAARTVIEAQNHQDLPFESLIDALRVPRSISHAPIFQVMFVVNNAREPLSLHGLVVSPVRIETIFSKFDLTFTLSTGHDGVRGSIEYSSELFDRPTVEGMAAEFLRLVDDALHGADRRISSLPTADVKVKPNSPVKPPHGKPVVATARPVSSSYPPSTAAAKLSRLWCEVLGLPRVGVDDNFFELGGNSLLAVRLFADIENEFGVKLPLSSLFHEGTVSAQARFLVAGQHGERWSPLVPIQPNGTQPPLFLVHGIGAEVLSFSHLAEHVGRDQPIFGLRPSTQDPTFFSTVESVAATYVHAIRAIDPRGPYRIGGYSSGGVIAYEMAQQLQTAGARVTVLAMLDSTAAGTLQRALTPVVMWRMLKNAAYWPVDDDFLRSAPLDQVRRVASKIKRRRVAVDIRDRLGVWKFPESARDTLEAHYRMLLAYRPEPYSGVVTVLRARTLRLSFRGTPDLGWRVLARGGLRLRVVEGAHDNILTEPRVRRLAAALVECLNGA
jgi:amino acid adenylation domain-containing protein